jgi:hypothetical protein
MLERILEWIIVAILMAAIFNVFALMMGCCN